MQFALSHSVQGAVPVAIPNNVYPCATENGERAIVPFTVFRFNVSSDILSYEHLVKVPGIRRRIDGSTIVLPGSMGCPDSPAADFPAYFYDCSGSIQ